MALSWRQLEVFRTFAYTQNVSEVARLLHISQPAVSQMLKDIEAELGFQVFQRWRGRMKVSDEGMLLVPEVERLIAQMSRLKGRAAEIKDANAGLLSIASVPTLFVDLLPRILLSFRKKHDRVKLRVSNHTADEIVKMVRQDRADVGFAFLPFDEANVAVLPLMKMRVVVIVPVDDELATREVLTVSDLNNRLVIVHGSQSPPGLMLRESITPQEHGWHILETNQSIPALHMVRHGLGVALVHPLTLSDDMVGMVKYVRFEPAIYLTLGMVYPRHRAATRVVVQFEKHVREQVHLFCSTMGRQGLECESLV
jgi:DNA-binding transcriptional LysR family regulator